MVRDAGKAAGVLAPDPGIAAEYVAAGATFVAVGTDTGLLSRAASDLAASYKKTAGAATPVKGGTKGCLPGISGRRVAGLFLLSRRLFVCMPVALAFP